jgi:NAD(P)-dependent dehydrogenase (short-subunit alcohol dehydrogenase family)
MGGLDGKVAVITGAGHGQGRSHAVNCSIHDSQRRRGIDHSHQLDPRTDRTRRNGAAATFAYAASKHGVVGLMRSAGHAYAEHSIRVNAVHPTGVATPMVLNDHIAGVFAHDPSAAKLATNRSPVSFVEPEDVTNAVVWLASDKARYVTGIALPIDAGYTAL